MSMNLGATCNDGRAIELYQTPTYITRMILVSSDGPVASLKGKKARRALHSYIEWVLEEGSQVFDSDEEYSEYLERANIRREHARDIEKFLDCPDLEVYWL